MEPETLRRLLPHLAYEIQMLLETADLAVAADKEESRAKKLTAYALLESFQVHYLNVAGFLDGTGAVVAQDYVRDWTWTDSAVASARKRVLDDVVSFGTHRVEDAMKRAWYPVEAARVLMVPFLEWLGRLPKDTIQPEWTDAIDDYVRSWKETHA